MIDRYLVIKYEKEDVLVLFINYNFEFSKIGKKGNDTIKKNIINYINQKKIKFNGNIIRLVIGGIFIATFIFSNNDIRFKEFDDEKINYVSKENISYKVPIINKINDTKEIQKKVNEWNTKSTIKSSKKVSNNTIKKEKIKKPEIIEKNVEKANEEMITVYRNNGSVITIGLEEYVIGVVAIEMPASFDIESLKAQSILARTYALKSKIDKKRLTDTVKTQRYIDKYEMKKKWGSEYTKYYNKISSAVNLTKGMVVLYNDKYIDAVYHSTSNGYTEDAIEVWGYNVPYLKSVDSHWDVKATSYLKNEKMQLSEVITLLGLDKLEELKISKRDSSGRVSEVIINNQVYTGINIREILSLRSADFDLEITDNYLNVTTRGYGHGVGMSQYGSNLMAKEGYNYEQIIKHYYTGVYIKK